MFTLERPKCGTLVAACAGEPTLYGRTITVTAVSDNGGAATDSWHEKEYDPQTNQERWRVMQAAKRFARGDDADARAQHIYDSHQHDLEAEADEDAR